MLSESRAQFVGGRNEICKSCLNQQDCEVEEADIISETAYITQLVINISCLCTRTDTLTRIYPPHAVYNYQQLRYTLFYHEIEGLEIDTRASLDSLDNFESPSSFWAYV